MRRSAVFGVLVLFMLVGAVAPAHAVPGGQVWVRRYNDQFNGRDFAASVKVSADHFRLYVTGTSWQGKIRRTDWVTVAYSRAGVTLWVRRFNGRGSGDDHAAALARSPDGSRIFVTGQSYAGPATGMDFATVAYSSTGTRLWTRRYDGPVHGRDGASAIAVSADGTRIYVTGTSAGGASGDDYATVAYDAATGAQLWAQRFDSFADDRAASVAVSQDGTRVYVTGRGQDPATRDPALATVAYDAATGSHVWVAFGNADTFGATIYDAQAAGVVVSGDGTRVYVAGITVAGSDQTAGVTIAYSSAGTELWRDTGAEWTALALSIDGARLYVGGFDQDFGLQFLAAIASDGTPLWSRQYGSSSPFCAPGPSELAVTRDGTRIYLTSGTSSCQGGDYLTAAYSSAGKQLWARRYNGPGNGRDFPHGIALSPDQAWLYVTGGSWGGPSTRQDYATIAYKTAQ
jgi:DNA-binding beta-propeller fold protein YncE